MKAKIGKDVIGTVPKSIPKIKPLEEPMKISKKGREALIKAKAYTQRRLNRIKDWLKFSGGCPYCRNVNDQILIDYDDGGRYAPDRVWFYCPKCNIEHSIRLSIEGSIREAERPPEM
jgi:hypothetical protein